MTQNIDVNSTESTIDVNPATEESQDIDQVLTTIHVDGDAGNQLVSIDSPSYSIEASSSSAPTIDASTSTHDIHIGDNSGGGPVAAHTHTVISNDLTVVGDLDVNNLTAVGDVNANNLTAVGDVNANNLTAVGDLDANNVIAVGNLSADNLKVGDGSESSPSHSFTNYNDTGMYGLSGNIVGFSTGGTEVLRLTGNDLRMAATDSKIENVGSVRGVLASSTDATPTYTFDGDTTTGMYAHATTKLAFSAGGDRKMMISTSVNQSYQQFNMNSNRIYNVVKIELANGTSAAPTYTFTNDTATGIYHNGSSGLGFSASGYPMMVMNTDGTYFYDHADSANYVNIHAGGTYGRITTSKGLFYLNKPIQVDQGIISSYDENLTLQDSGTTCAILDAANNTVGLTVYENYGGFTGDNAGILIRTRNGNAVTGEVAGLSMWTQHSTDRHVHQRVYYATGDAITYRNWENTAWVSLQALSFAVQSTIKSKDRVRTARDERGLLDYAVPGPRKMAFKQHRKLRPVLFDNKSGESLTEWIDCPGYDVRDHDHPDDSGDTPQYKFVKHDTREECGEAHCEGEKNMRRIEHHCDDYICGGTAERPCDLISRHVNRVGLIAEEIEEIYPRAVTQDMYGDEKGLDYAVLVTELMNTVTHLLEDRDEQRSITAREILARRRLEARLDALETEIRTT